MRILSLLVIALTVAIFITGCYDSAPDDSQVSRQAQQDVMERAMGAEPAYIPNSYPARESINRYLQEMEIESEWYTYALNMMGEPVFYIVSDYKPINICVSLTAPDRVERSSYGVAVRSAPALDGVYYGGANCNAYYAFDANTGGMIELAGSTFTLVSSRFPLRLETDIPRLQPEVRAVVKTN